MDRICGTLKPGFSAELQWITLWKSALTYRTDGQKWGDSWGYFAYYDDRRVRFDKGRMHRPRVPEATRANAVRFQEPKVLHFGYAFWERLLAKHRWYRMLERIFYPTKDVRTINASYIQHLKGEQSACLSQVPEAWIAPWLGRGMQLPEPPGDELSWHEVECLRLFRQYGVSHSPIRELKLKASPAR